MSWMTRPRRIGANATALILVVLIWFWTGFHALVWHDGARGLVQLSSGTLLIEWVEECGPGVADNSRFLADTWHPDLLPNVGLHVTQDCNWNWDIPEIHRAIISSMGTWWFIRVPGWLLIAIFAMNSGLAHGVFHRTSDSRSVWIAFYFTGVALLALALSTAAISFFRHVRWQIQGQCAIDLDFGRVQIEHDLEPEVQRWCKASWSCGPCIGYRRGLLRSLVPHTARVAQSTFGEWRETVVPLWLPAGVAASVAYTASRRLRRHRPGHCTNCSYDLTGNRSGACPECGTTIASPGLRRPSSCADSVPVA